MQRHIQLKQKQQQLMQSLETQLEQAKQLMEAAIIEANTALAKLPEGSDTYTRLDFHNGNAQTIVTSLHSANQAMFKLPV
jgi:hypothetical protein